MRSLSILALLLASFAVPRPGHGEDDPLGPPPTGDVGAPPTADPNAPVEPAPSPEIVDPSDGPDFRDIQHSLSMQLARIAQPPARLRNEPTLANQWNGAVRPRLLRMRQAVEELGKESRYEFDPATGRAIGIVESEWPRVIREASTLHAALAGAHDDLLVAFHRVMSTRHPGVPVPDVPEYYTTHSLSLLAYERLMHRKLLLGHPIPWHDEVDGYHLFLRRLVRDVIRREEAIARNEAIEAAVARYEAAFAERVEQLSIMLLTVRTFVTALQAVEEDRLHALVAALSADDPRIADLKVDLSTIRAGRLEARTQGELKPTGYGGVLRSKWLQPRARLLSRLGKTVAPDLPDDAE